MDPRDQRLRTSAFVKAGGVGLIIDIGPDFRRQMLARQITDVHAVLLTHEHNDHISGLDDIRPINFLYKRDMPVYGAGRTLSEMKRRFNYAFDPQYQYPGKPRVTAIEIGNDPFEVNHVSIMPVPVDHGDMMIYGFRIGSLAYVTDAKTIPDSGMALLQGLDILILNALRFKAHPTHLNIEEAIELCRDLRPRQCYLTHISHEMGLHAVVDEMLPENMHLGYDGLTISVS